MTLPHFLFQECGDDRTGVVAFKHPSESAKVLLMGRSLICLLVVLGMFLGARHLARSAPDWGDRCALYAAALLLGSPGILALYAMAKALWVLRAVVIHLAEGTLSEIHRTPFKATASHYSLSEVRFILVVADESIWHVMIELAGDSFVALGFANDENHARAFARRVAAVLKVGIRDDTPELLETAAKR